MRKWFSCLTIHFPQMMFSYGVSCRSDSILRTSGGIPVSTQAQATGLRGGRDVWCFHPRPSSKRSRWSGLDSVGGQVGNPKLSNFGESSKKRFSKGIKNFMCLLWKSEFWFAELYFNRTSKNSRLPLACHKGFARELCCHQAHILWFGTQLPWKQFSSDFESHSSVQLWSFTRPYFQYCKIRIVPCNDLMIWFSYILILMSLMCMWTRQIDHIEKTVREVGRNDLNHRFEPMRPAQAG